MKTDENEVVENELRRYLKTVASGDLKAIVQRMIEETMTTHFIFRNWRLGITKVPLLERKTINRISQEYNGKDAFKLEDHGTDPEPTET